MVQHVKRDQVQTRHQQKKTSFVDDLRLPGSNLTFYFLLITDRANTMLHDQAGRRAVREQRSGFFEKVGHFQLQNVPNEGHPPVV